MSAREVGRSSEESELARRIASVMFAALQQSSPDAYLFGAPEQADRTTVDGKFNLRSVARAVIRDLRRSGYLPDRRGTQK
jgi:hypothetical protein